MAYKRALSRGTGEALWGLFSGLKELSDLSTQHLNHALGAAWETWRHGDERRYLQTFLEHFKEAEFQELVDVLGIDPRSITREQWAEAQSLLNFLWHDEETRALLIDFANDYIDAQHGLELAEAGAGMLTEIAVDILITALTLGMGAALAVTTKVRQANKLGGLGKALKQLAQKLKQKAGSKRARSQTGTWLYEDLEKPDHKSIEPRDGPDARAYNKGDSNNSATMQVGNTATGNRALFSSNELAGVERASPDLLSSVGQKRAITFAEEGSDALRFLDYRNAEAAAFGAEDIVLRTNPSKAAVLEEFLHGTQQKLGIIEDIGRAASETHVKDFMIRHQKLLGLGEEDVKRLQILKDMGL